MDGSIIENALLKEISAMYMQSILFRLQQTTRVSPHCPFRNLYIHCNYTIKSRPQKKEVLNSRERTKDRPGKNLGSLKGTFIEWCKVCFFEVNNGII